MAYKYPSKYLLEKHSAELGDDQKYYNLSKVVYDNDFNNKLVFPVGIDNKNEKFYIDFEEKSSILIAGETGSGKSIYLNDIIISFLLKNSPEELRFVMIDPRGAELGVYNGLPHLDRCVFSNQYSSLNALNYIINTLEARRQIFVKNGSRNIKEYNKKATMKMFHIIVILDEIIDIVEQEEFHNILQQLLSEGYKFGIHLILATNGYFRDYFPKDILNMFNYILTFDLASKEQANYIRISDSNLLSVAGDALIKCPGDRIINIQAPYVSLRDIEEVVNFIKQEN